MIVDKFRFRTLDNFLGGKFPDHNETNYTKALVVFKTGANVHSNQPDLRARLEAVAEGTFVFTHQQNQASTITHPVTVEERSKPLSRRKYLEKILLKRSTKVWEFNSLLII